MIFTEPMTSRMDTPFAVFIIGMRVNKPLHVHRWLPALLAMPRMLKELYAQPQYGLLSHETWFSRNIILLQYWRSFEALVAYAGARDSEHLPAWKAFNRSNAGSGAVGIWHETYVIGPGAYENVYVNMPAFGLGRAGTLGEAKSVLRWATERLHSAPGAGGRTDEVA
jgi:hypothetical protein